MYPLHPNEISRLKALRDLDVFGAQPEPQYDAICRTAQALFGVKVALVSLVGETEQRFKGRCGLDASGTPREVSFCTHTILSEEVLVVEDATRDSRFSADPLVTGEPHIRFYAGAPLVLSPGIHLGSLCIIDSEPRAFPTGRQAQLRDLAQIVVAQLRLSKAEREAREGAERLRESEADLLEANRSLRMAEQWAQVGHWRMSLPDGRLTWSDGVFSIFGRARDAGQPSIREVLAAFHADDCEEVDSRLKRAAREGTAYEHRTRLLRPNGETRTILAHAVAERTEAGTIAGLFGVCIDVTDLVEARQERQRSDERLTLALENGNDGLWDWDGSTQSLWFSQSILGMLGYVPGDIAASMPAWESLIHTEDAKRVTHLFFQHLKGDTPVYEAEHRLRRKDGSYAWVLARGRVVSRDPHGRALRVVGTHIDISDRKLAEERITHLARHDILTDLPNRMQFHESLERRLAEVNRRGASCAVLYGDLDRFKTINDTLGHLAGDEVLRQVATRLRAVVRREDVVARLGGDEFVVLQVGDDSHPQGAADLAQRLIAAVNQPIRVGSREVEVGLSLGISVAPGDAADGSGLIRHADLALYRAKAEGRNTFRFYEEAMDEAIEERRQLEVSLRGALSRDEFEVHYQPIVRAEDGCVSGAEALVRWRHPERGLVSPAAFIPLAEETGLIRQIGEWVLYTACREAASWPEGMRVAVNVSALQFRQPGLVAAVAGALSSSGLPATRLELEITESVLVDDGSMVTETLHRLRALGVHTSLDDFGTGYSSLSYLRRFPFDKLKIDQSFVRDVAEPGMRCIVRAIVNLGHGLGMTITAEGVETVEQLEIMRNKGCTEIQGYLFSKPLPSQAFRHYLERRPNTVQAV